LPQYGPYGFTAWLVFERELIDLAVGASHGSDEVFVGGEYERLLGTAVPAVLRTGERGAIGPLVDRLDRVDAVPGSDDESNQPSHFGEVVGERRPSASSVRGAPQPARPCVGGHSFLYFRCCLSSHY
jgi:hypothetical protein